MTDDRWFDRLAEATDPPPPERAPARVTSRVYSAVVAAMAESGALLDLRRTKDAGGRLCVFEEIVAILPLGTDLQSRNPCRVCHARVLGERLDRAPIFWPGCPYSEFHNG
jgi:hypothetical protein